MDREYPLRDVNRSQCYVLAESLRNSRYNYARGMIAVYASTIVNYEGPTYTTSVDSVGGMKLLNDGRRIAPLDGRDLRRSAEMLADEDGVKLAVEPLRIRNAFRVEDKHI